MKLKNIYLVLAALVLAVSGPSAARAQYRQNYQLTGTYRLNASRSDNPLLVADRVSRNLLLGSQERRRDAIMRRLEAPESLAFDVQGRMVTMASPHSSLVTFEANGRAQPEMSRNGRGQRTTATLVGQTLMVSTAGDRTLDYQATFELIDGGRNLRVTRTITDEDLRRPVMARSIYDRVWDNPRWETLNSGSPPAFLAARDTWIIPDGTAVVATLNDNLSTRQARDGDHFTLTVQSPAQYRGAAIEGHVVQANRSGRIAGRSEMTLDFDRIRMRDGRVGDFAGYIESVRTTNGETVNVDSEGTVRSNSQTERTVTRGGIGAAIGAVIGAIADGGKGAAIGAVVGGGAGAGSVFAQGRDDLDLISGTEIRLRTKNAS